ncbi:hypothetical protein [Deinococcus carri]
MLGALWTLLTQLFLALLGQPVPGQSRAERTRNLRQRTHTEPERAGALAALRAVVREALLALTFQPSPESPPASSRSASSRRKPRS